MSSPQAFVADACDHPNDPGRRLVFADWCEENGDADRAEFIRAQIRLESMPGWDPERFDLEERSLDLLAGHRDEWIGDLPAWARREPVAFRCGLPGEMRLPPGRFLSHGDRLVRSLPLIRLTLDGLNNRAGELGCTDAVRGLPELEIDGVSADAAHLREFMKHLRSDHLSHLGLGSKSKARNRGRVGPNDALSGWPGLERLTSFALRHASFDDARLAKLLGSSQMGQLQRLDLSNTEVGRRACAAIADNERLAGLRRLDLHESALNDGGLRALARAGWRDLEGLRLSFAWGISDAVLEEVAGSGWFDGLASLEVPPALAPALTARVPSGRLRHLTLGWGGLPDSLDPLLASDLAAGLTSLAVYTQTSAADVPAFASSPRLSGLVRLTFGSCWQASDVVCDLIGSEHLTGLRELSVYSCQITAKAAACLPQLDGLSRLRSLSLCGCFLNDRGVAALARSSLPRNLRRLDLSNNEFSDPGLLALLEAPWAPSLRELRLWYTRITSAGVAELANSASMENLRVLELNDRVVTRQAAEALAESPHLGKLLRLHIGPKRPEGDELLRERFGGVLVVE
jgi:uncharacterized protein (TIGR02996 family)